ncbi:hypothetical protein N7520_003762 [Penicillium odoratum]|uniref:uncharacterized protein n=1 Tax=Penicillium odoratum TaxID=1167516 RepID=UPI002547C030|nr:uncharacterized protein N7520_003762 [Penicillium odoratum]KAJ5769203.1 hypothetical protein N7520_003762 [Penicillium odoratum]
MSDLRTFDAASRGLFGSAALIWDLRARHFAVPGSLAVILAIAFDPFTQNLLHYYPKLTPDASQIAIVSNNSVYDVVGSQLGLDGEAYVDPTLKANVYNSIFNNDPSKPWSIPNYTCGTGNCTWDPITSLGMQAVCSDVTKYLDFQCHTITNDTADLAMVGERNCSIHLRFNSSTSTISANYIENGPVATAVVAGPGGVSIIQEDSPFYHVQIIAPDQSINEVDVFTNSTKWQALECALQPIVRRFRPSVTGGIYHEDTLSVWKNRSANQDLDGYSLSPPWGPEMGIEKNTTFMITFEAIRAMDPFMYFFAGSVESALGRITFIPVEGYATYASADFMQAIAVSNITGCTATGSERLRCAMENAAAAMSKTFRDSTPSAADSQGAKSSTLGHAMSNTTYVTVHWQWISLPILVWLLGIITLVGTILRSRRAVVPTWKNDVMPLLFIYEGGQDEQLLPDGELENEKRVRLHDFEGRVWLAE